MGEASFLCVAMFLATLVTVAPGFAQSPSRVGPDLVAPGSVPAPEGEKPDLTRSEERRLLRNVLWQPDPEWNATSAASAELVEKLIGRGRVRRLDEARFHLHLAADDWDLRNLADDEYSYERTKDAVLSSYVKLQREILEDAFQVEERFDAWVDQITHREERRAARGERGRSYNVRFSPRASVGSSNYLGIKMRMPYAENRFLDHLSFRVRHYFDEDRTAFILKFDSEDHFVHLEYEPGTEDDGDLLSLSVRLWF